MKEIKVDAPMANEKLLTIVDHIVRAGKSLGASVPGWASVVQAMDEYVPSAHDRANQRAAEILMKEVSALGHRLDEELVRKDEFVELLKDYIVIVERSQFDDKFRAAANILCNALLKEDDSDKLTYSELDHFAHCVESLTLASCHVLGRAIRCAGGGYNTYFYNIRDSDSTVAPDLLLGLLKELESKNLVAVNTSMAVTYGKQNYPIEISPLGFRFAKYILPPSEPQ